MTDRIFLRLDDKFALGADDLQWLVCRAHQRKNGLTWDPISFVRSTKAILLRCIREAGCKPTEQAQLALESYPDTFDAWKAVIPAQGAALEAAQ
jgi:hypothetical protein